MNEEKVNETVESEVESSEPTAFENLLQDTVKFVGSFGKAFVSTAQDTSNLLLVTVDAETREQLDLLVNSGAAVNRREAAAALIREGLGSRNGILEKIRQTNTQIADLRQQMRTLAGEHS